MANKLVIAKYKNKKFMGYIKSVSPKTMSYTITYNFSNARGFNSLELAASVIETLMHINMVKGDFDTVFICTDVPIKGA